jgi:predicted nucleic acid-binding protein
MALVLDTGPILALLDAGDPDHDRCVALVDGAGEDLVVPVTVLVEVDYWVLKLLGPKAWSVFVDDVARGAYRLEPLEIDDLQRAAELERTYANLDLGLVDASVVAVCERLGEAKVATLDRRDFSVVRPSHCEALHILPEP